MKRQRPCITVRFQWLSILLLTTPSWEWWSLQAYIVSILNRSLNCHHLKCRHEALPVDFLSQIEILSPFKGMWLQNPCVLLSSETDCILPVIFVSDRSKQEGFKIFLKHSWQLSFDVILPLSLMREANTLTGGKYWRLSIQLLNLLSMKGVSRLTNFSTLDRSLNYHHFQCRQGTLPFNFHLRIESFSLSAVIILLFFVLTPLENVSIILSVMFVWD